MNKNIDSLINFYKEQISNHISEVKQYQVSKELKRFASLFTPGKFYYYVINFQNLAMDFVSSGTKDVLGIEPSDFTVNELLNRIHPEDLEAMKKKEEHYNLSPSTQHMFFIFPFCLKNSLFVFMSGPRSWRHQIKFDAGF